MVFLLLFFPFNVRAKRNQAPIITKTITKTKNLAFFSHSCIRKKRYLNIHRENSWEAKKKRKEIKNSKLQEKCFQANVSVCTYNSHSIQKKKRKLKMQGVFLMEKFYN